MIIKFRLSENSLCYQYIGLNSWNYENKNSFLFYTFVNHLLISMLMCVRGRGLNKFNLYKFINLKCPIFFRFTAKVVYEDNEYKLQF